MRDELKSAVRKTAEALQAELDAGKHKGREKEVKAAIVDAKKAVGPG